MELKCSGSQVRGLRSVTGPQSAYFYTKHWRNLGAMMCKKPWPKKKKKKELLSGCEINLCSQQQTTCDICA